MQFDLILTNPPFQDSTKRGKTPHKLWIDFTQHVFSSLLREGGSLIQVSPSSFGSPSNVVLQIMAENQTKLLRFGTEHHFPGVNSTFSDYWIQKMPSAGVRARIFTGAEMFETEISPNYLYLPNDLSKISLSIHEKVMFRSRTRLSVKWDYVTAHNIRRHSANPTLVTSRDDAHPYPVFHTNRSTWWSSLRQDWADSKKVMWTRSGYTKPFYDDGSLGGTDMVYYILVDNQDEGRALAHNMNSKLYRYIYKTAKWSGFGNERVFSNLPEISLTHALTDDQIYEYFEISGEEADYIERTVEGNRKENR